MGLSFHSSLFGPRSLLLASVCFGLACSGKVYTIEGDGDGDDDPSAGGTGGQMVGVGGSFTGGTGGGSGGTPDDPYVEPECPDEPAPPVAQECDPFSEVSGCLDGEGCYPYLDYPYGQTCGHATFGTVCATASTGEQGDFCGDGGNYCAPGYMCVVGTAGGKRCGKICQPVKDHGCPAGLICGETDIQGYGVCY